MSYSGVSILIIIIPRSATTVLVDETAPTLGKFYVKANHGQDYGMWGNLKRPTTLTTTWPT